MTLSLSELHEATKERLEEVRAAKDEYEKLEAALTALGGVNGAEPEAQAPRRRGRPRKTPAAT